MKLWMACALSAWAFLTSAATAQEFFPITTEEVFRYVIVGQRITDGTGHNHMRINKDGTFRGRVEGKPVTGKWLWSHSYFCRNGRFNGQELGSDCQTIEFDGKNRMRVTQSLGDGEAAILSLRK